VDDAAAIRVLYVGRGRAQPRGRRRGAAAGEVRGRGGDGYADLAVLRGDPSDGLPGVAGIGEKTAAGLLARFGSLAGLLEAAADPATDISAGQRRKLADAAEYLAKAPAVVRVARDAPVTEHDDLLPQTPPDHAALVAFAERWGVESSVARVVQRSLPRAVIMQIRGPLGGDEPRPDGVRELHDHRVSPGDGVPEGMITDKP
jgi:hypothetical protein